MEEKFSHSISISLIMGLWWWEKNLFVLAKSIRRTFRVEQKKTRIWCRTFSLGNRLWMEVSNHMVCGWFRLVCCLPMQLHYLSVWNFNCIWNLFCVLFGNTDCLDFSIVLWSSFFRVTLFFPAMAHIGRLFTWSNDYVSSNDTHTGSDAS